MFLCAEVRDPEDCAQVLRGVASSPACPAQYGLTLLSVVRHAARLCLHGSRNQLSPRTVAENFSPLLFRQTAGSEPNTHTHTLNTHLNTCSSDIQQISLMQREDSEFWMFQKHQINLEHVKFEFLFWTSRLADS